MKEETKEQIKQNTEAVGSFLTAHPVIRGMLIGFALGLLACWLF